jgi:hypothetical protein
MNTFSLDPQLRLAEIAKPDIQRLEFLSTSRGLLLWWIYQHDTIRISVSIRLSTLCALHSILLCTVLFEMKIYLA